MIDRPTAERAIADARTPAAVLAEIAQSHPALRVMVSYHPNTYPALLDWLAAQGDPQVVAAVQAVRARMAAYQAAYAPVVPLPPEKSGVRKALDSMTGFEGDAIVRFRDLFRDTFKKHSRADLDALMCYGTRTAMSDRQWRLPWLYSRVFVVLLGAFLLLWVCVAVFGDASANVVPGVIFTGALVIPASLMIFFWEFNQAKNVSLFDVIRFFFIGGAMSILLTFIVTAITDLFHDTEGYGYFAAFVTAIFIGFTEELAKAIVVLIMVRRLWGCLVSNGLLVGAVVGTGFAVFETMGYGTYGWTVGQMEFTLILRGVLSIGGHVVWSAICGAAIMLAQRKGVQQVDIKTMDWGKFITLFCVPFILHAAWDFIAFVVYSDLVAYILMGALIVIAWVFIVRLINSGLRQYATLLGQAR